MKDQDTSCCEQNVYDSSISLNGVFVFKLPIGYDLLLCLKILHKGLWCFWVFENQDSPEVKPQQVVASYLAVDH